MNETERKNNMFRYLRRNIMNEKEFDCSEIKEYKFKDGNGKEEVTSLKELESSTLVLQGAPSRVNEIETRQ